MDTRSEDEKAKDFQHAEIASGAVVSYQEREPKHFLIFNQDGSSSCVANAVAKVLGIDEMYEGRPFVDLSRRDIYTRRTNIGEGMFLPEALSIATKHGATLESLVTSESKNETDMNKKDDITPETDAIALKYRANGYVALPINIDSIASIIQQGKAVLLGFRFDIDEWTNFPTVNPNSKQTVGHGVAGVDNVLKDGKKYIIIDDSWSPHYGIVGQRYISEEFLKAHCFYAGYTLNLILEPSPVLPKYHFTKILVMSKTVRYGDKDVIALQDALKALGFFPKNIESTGYFGAITKKAVQDFQKAHNIMQTGNFGVLTMAEMNKVLNG